MLMKPATPIASLAKKFRSKPSRGVSLDGLQALSGMGDSGEFVMTPVGSDAARVGDGDVSCASSDGGSEESGGSVEEGGGGRGGTAAADADAVGRTKRVAKLAMGISHGFRRKKRPMGASEAMTIGRASLNGDNVNSYLRAHDFEGEGARSYAGGWGKGSSSPEHGSRCVLYAEIVTLPEQQYAWCSMLIFAVLWARGALLLFVFLGAFLLFVLSIPASYARVGWIVCMNYCVKSLYAFSGLVVKALVLHFEGKIPPFLLTSLAVPVEITERGF